MELKIRRYYEKAKSEIIESIKEEHTPHETAFSFALGAFIILIPTSAMGLFILGAIAVTFDRINRIALFSTAVVFNPAVNMAFYGLSYFTGSIILGSPSLPDLEMFSLTQTFMMSQNIIIGSLVTAFLISSISYVLVHKISTNIRLNNKEPVIEVY